MPYKFSNMIGRLVKDSASLSKGLQAVKNAGKIVYYPNTKVKSSFSRNQKPGFSKVHPSLLEKQRKFQVEDGVPIHLKGGPFDVVLYYTTLVLCGVGLFESFRYYYRAAVPKKAVEAEAEKKCP